VPKLTTRAVDAAKIEKDRYILWDAELKGFGLVVLPTSVKSYIFQYRTEENRKRRFTIGQHGTLTAHQARRKAEELRHAVRNGNDPLAHKQELRNAKTVGMMLDEYLASPEFLRGKAASTQAIDRGRIERHLRPLLGKRHVHRLTTRDVKDARKAIRDRKTATDLKTKTRGRAIVKGGEGTAREAIALLRAILNWAEEKPNPCDGIKLGSSGTRDIILGDAQDYARLFQALDKMETERRIRQPVADAIRLIALTGCRRGEAAGLRWRHINLKENRIVLPPLEHKTGRKTARRRVIALPSAAQAIIARQPVSGEDGYVFAPAKGKGALALSRAWALVRKEAKLPKGIGLHGLRHSVASHLAMGGAQAAEIMAAMGHRQLSTVQRYIHFAETAQQLLAERAANIVMKGMAVARKKAS
jgi:integrase